MKSKVLDRPMFKGKKLDPDEVGIMSLLIGDDMEDEGDESDMSKLMDRRPDSPEILMNNLRGDIRSVDARFEELADMVGYDAAQQTPPEVLALLQPVLAAEQQGVAALPAMAPQGSAAPMPMPPQETAAPMPPAAPPQGMPPGGIGSLPTAQGPQAPMGMARGGLVQNFSDGSDEDAVKPKDSEASAITLNQLRAVLGEQGYEKAQKAFASRFAPITVPTLRAATESKIPEYQRLLGQDKGLTQAQMLFDVAGAGLALAGNVDPRTGQPLRGSFAARLAGAASQLPAQIGARASEAEKMAQQIKLLGIQSAEKDIERRLAQQTAQSKELGDLFSSALKAETALRKPPSDLSARAPWNLMNYYMPQWVMGENNAKGDLSEDDLIKFMGAVEKASETKYIPYTDEYGRPQVREEKGVLPTQFKEGYIKRYGEEAWKNWYGGLPDKPLIRNMFIPSLKEQTGQQPGTTVTGERPATTAPSAVSPTTAAPSATVSTGMGLTKPPPMPSIRPVYDSNKLGLWQNADKLTGPIDFLSVWAARTLPIDQLGENYRASETAKKNAEKEVQNLIGLLATNMDNNGREYVSVPERSSLEKRFDIFQRVFSNVPSYQTSLISLHDELTDRLKRQEKIVQEWDSNRPVDVNLARRKIDAIQSVLGDFNLPPMVYKNADRESIPQGSEYIDRRDPKDITTVKRGSIRDIYGRIDDVFMGEQVGDNAYRPSASSKKAWEKFYANSPNNTPYIIRLPDGTQIVKRLSKPAATKSGPRLYGENVPNKELLPTGADDW